RSSPLARRRNPSAKTSRNGAPGRRALPKKESPERAAAWGRPRKKSEPGWIYGKKQGRRGQAPALRDFSNDARSLTCPLIRLAVRPATFPIPSVASRHLPLIRGVGPQGEGLKRAGIKIPMHKKENSPAAQRRTGC